MYVSCNLNLIFSRNPLLTSVYLYRNKNTLYEIQQKRQKVLFLRFTNRIRKKKSV